MQACPNDQCPHRKLTGQRAAFEGDRTHCSDCDAALVAVEGEDAPDEAPAARPVAPSGRGRRLAVSLAVVAAFEAIRRAPSPVLSEHFLDDRGADFLLQVSALDSAQGSVLSAFVTVELVALLVPTLRRRRHDHPATRRKLTAASWCLALFFCASQGWAAMQAADSYGMDDSGRPWLLASYAAAPLAVALGLKVLDRFGFGGPWPWVAGWGLAAFLTEEATRWVRLGDLAPGHVVVKAAWVVAWGALGWWLLRRRFEVAAGVDAKAPVAAYRGAATGDSVPLSLRAPLWGTFPISIAAAVVLIPSRLQALVPSFAPASDALGASPWTRAVTLTLVALALSWLFARLPTSLRRMEERLTALGLRPDGTSVALARAQGASLRMALAAGALTLVGGVAGFPAVDLTLGVYALTLVAMGLDLVGEWRANGALGPLAPLLRDQRVWLADATAAVLERGGVPAFVRHANYHQLAWWGAPQAPAVVMVPSDRVDEARALLEEREAGSGELPS